MDMPCGTRSDASCAVLSVTKLFPTLATPMGFPRQDYWSGLTFPSPGDLPDPGIEPRSRALQADALTSEQSNDS